MPLFFASAPKGMTDPLEAELKELKVKIKKVEPAGIYFEGNWADCYRVNLCSRIASRILKPITDFIAYQAEDLYRHTAKHDFTKYISPEQTFSINAKVKDSKLHDQRFVAMKIKDAIADQFREKFGDRPDVDNEDPDLRVFVKAYKNQFFLSIDTSGESLFKRGYRVGEHPAPLKENLAAGLIRLSGWKQDCAVVDLMCGSGTFLIEAAMIALDLAPALQRDVFAFMQFKGFQREVWQKVQKEMEAKVKAHTKLKFYGYDINPKAIAAARANAKAIGLDTIIEFKAMPMQKAVAPAKNGFLLINPPYGERIGETEKLQQLYQELSSVFKQQFKGWEAWILAGEKEWIKALRLKSTRKIPVYNGNIECRFLRYEIF